MAYSSNNNGIKEEKTTHLQALLQAQLSAEDSRNIDTNDSIEKLRESPLDFSIKRKSQGSDEVSGSDSASSPTSSLNDTTGRIEDRKSDNDVFVNINDERSPQVSPPDRSPYFRHKQLKNEHHRRQQLLIHERNGQNHSTAEQSGGSSLGLPNLLHGLQMSIANANMIGNTFSTMSALMDPRKLMTSSPKCTRPFKAYPNDPLSISVENSNLPHYLTSLATFENSAILQGLTLSSEEMLSVHKQQLLALSERERYLETLRLSQEQYPIKTSTVTTLSPSIHIPTSLVSAYVSGKNNGVNSNLIGSVPAATSSSSLATSPSLQRQHSNNSNGSSHHSNKSYLQAVQSLTSGSRRRPRSLPDEQKDEAYWERRRKNNEAAKRSRDTRRAKEDQIAIRATILEQENLKLRVEIASLKNETAKLRYALYNS